MGKRKTLDKAQARERRNKLLESAAAAELSLTEGVREMRAIAGMTQEEFAKHRGVSARVIKALELEQGNPTVATLNRIGQFFGLEVAFVPIMRMVPTEAPHSNNFTTQGSSKLLPSSLSTKNASLRLDTTYENPVDYTRQVFIQAINDANEALRRQMTELFAKVDNELNQVEQIRNQIGDLGSATPKKKLSAKANTKKSRPS